MNPYPGLRPFRADEARFFVGREIVLRYVQMRVEAAPLTVLFARSGVGKSSFLTCRFIPSIVEKRRVVYVNEWGSEEPAKLINKKVDQLLRESEAFTQKPLLVLDQFEDVFKFPYERIPLWETLAEFVNVSEPRINVLISMREEWLGAWGDVAEYLPDVLSSTVRLAPLSESEVLRAIARPAQIEATVTMTPSLAKEIVHDLQSPNAYGLGEKYVELGLAQLVCSQLWETAAAGSHVMDEDLYNNLGRADSIIRNFVWKELGNAGEQDSRYTADDRVLMSGITRHLILAPGVKSILSSTGLLGRLRLIDFGVAGPAVVAAIGGVQGLQFLETPPEKRKNPPAALQKTITEFLSKSAAAGFLKEQRGLDGESSLYELSHDALGGILQQFSLEFERWIARRVGFLTGAVMFLLLVFPWLVFLVITEGILAMLTVILISTVALLVYGVLIWLLYRLGRLLWRVIAFPVIRRLYRGSVPMKQLTRPKPITTSGV